MQQSTLYQILMIFIVACSAVPVAAQEVEDILTAWKSTSAVPLTLHWTENVTVSQSSYGGTKDQPWPSEDVNFIRKCELQLHGNKARFSWSGLAWQAVVNRFEEEAYLMTFDGKEAREYYTNHVDRRSGAVHPVGFIEEISSIHDSSPFPIVSFSFRAHEVHAKLFDKALADIRIKGTEKFEGSTCIVLEQQVKPFVRTLHVDPSNGFVVKRCFIELQREGHREPISLWVADHKIDPDSKRLVPVAWVVKSWATMGGTQRVVEQVQSVVTYRKIGTIIPASQFNLKFPVGTIVRNDIVDADFLVRERGEMRKILAEEKLRGANYLDFLSTESGKAGI